MSYEKEVKAIRSLVPCVLKGAYVAGGAVTSVFTNQPVKDVDVYFRTEKDFMRAVVQMLLDEGGYCIDISSRAITFACGGDILQLCRLGFFEKPQDIFDAFDFTICMGTYDLEKGEFTLHEDFLKHNAQRYLKFNSGTKYPVASLLRTAKYQSRGYTIGKGELLKIALACHKVKLESWEDLEEQVGGAYGKKFNSGKDKTVPFSLDAAVASISEDIEWVSTLNNSVPERDYKTPYEETILEALGYSKEQIIQYFKEDEDRG